MFPASRGTCGGVFPGAEDAPAKIVSDPQFLRSPFPIPRTIASSTMIHDTLANAARYEGAHPLFREAFAWLREHAATAPEGKTVLRGEDLFASVSVYRTHSLDPARFEAHRRYADIQYVAEGEERVWVGDLSGMPESTPFDTAKDIGFYHGAGEFVTLRKGDFLVLFPGEVHAPGCLSAENPREVRKIVLKVSMWRRSRHVGTDLKAVPGRGTDLKVPGTDLGTPPGVPLAERRQGARRELWHRQLRIGRR